MIIGSCVPWLSCGGGFTRYGGGVGVALGVGLKTTTVLDASAPSLGSFLYVMKSVAPLIGATLTSAGPAMTTRLLISGKFCELAPVLKSIRIAVRTFALPPASPDSVT